MQMKPVFLEICLHKTAPVLGHASNHRHKRPNNPTHRMNVSPATSEILSNIIFQPFIIKSEKLICST